MLMAIFLLAVICITSLTGFILVSLYFTAILFIQRYDERQEKLMEQPPVTAGEQDIYTPNSSEKTVPLDQWTPNLSKPIKIERDSEDQISEMNG